MGLRLAEIMTDMTFDRRQTAKRTAAGMLLLLGTVLGTALSATAAEVNIYSYRELQLIEPLLKAFTAKTGIKTNVLFAKDGLNERMAAEGRNSPADLLLSTDVTRLVEAKAEALTQAFVSTELAARLPDVARDPDGHWIALTMRARVIFASRERVTETRIDYADLADPKWKGRICSRSGQYSYNTALIAAMIAHKGEAETERWLAAVKANLAHRPAGGDRDQVRDVASGKCDLAIANTYYMGLMATDTKHPEQKAWTDAVKVIFPRFEGGGTHINISGVALSRYAPHKVEALALIAFLASDEAQALYAEVNHEYPIVPAVAPSKLVQSWGKLTADSLPLDNIPKWRKAASELVDKVNFDAGPGS